MVANYRCNEIKEEATTQVLMDIDMLKKDSETRLVDNFEERCKKIIKEAVSHFDESASQYQKTVYEKVRKELAQGLFQHLFYCFDSQLKMLRQKFFEDFEI